MGEQPAAGPGLQNHHKAGGTPEGGEVPGGESDSGQQRAADCQDEAGEGNPAVQEADRAHDC